MISRQWKPEFMRLLSKGQSGKKKRRKADHSYQNFGQESLQQIISLTSKFYMHMKMGRIKHFEDQRT